MHAFDFIPVVFSFVYAAAVTHVLSTAGAIIIASKRNGLPSFCSPSEWRPLRFQRFRRYEKRFSRLRDGCSGGLSSFRSHGR
jgi:hypothetical protein